MDRFELLIELISQKFNLRLTYKLDQATDFRAIDLNNVVVSFKREPELN